MFLLEELVTGIFKFKMNLIGNKISVFKNHQIPVHVIKYLAFFVGVW